jgi:hypothetical protein
MDRHGTGRADHTPKPRNQPTGTAAPSTTAPKGSTASHDQAFGYTLLVQEAIAALEMTGLDAAVGFFHQARWGRPCLALDLIEEFRRSSGN